MDATKRRIPGDDALGVLDGVDTVIAARGKAVTVLDLRAGRPDDTALLAVLLGPTGNLRAPTARVGRTLMVGFNEDAYRRALGV